MKKIKAGVLGATGMVGQRFVQLLDGHPWFKLRELCASERSAGKSYNEALSGRWKIGEKVPGGVKDITVKECSPKDADCKIVFSALDSSVAGPIEEEFARAGFAVCSNSRNHRFDPDVPLLVPEVNHQHAQAVKSQKYGDGFIVTNPNCSTAGLVLPLKALMDAFGLGKVLVTTMQALSGAGFKGFELDIGDNVLPFISGEEGKVETEPLKILGDFRNGKFVNADIKFSAQCNRVNVIDGHLEAVNVKLSRKPAADELLEALRNFNSLKGMKLPSAPDPPIIVKEEEDRPQPKYDRNAGNGMAVTVGRIRDCPILDYKFLVLSHNTIRGAAGGSILNAELLVKNGLV
jgi:aspartate-semialdehyde dehydrogenase